MSSVNLKLLKKWCADFNAVCATGVYGIANKDREHGHHTIVALLPQLQAILDQPIEGIHPFVSKAFGYLVSDHHRSMFILDKQQDLMFELASKLMDIMPPEKVTAAHALDVLQEVRCRAVAGTPSMNLLEKIMTGPVAHWKNSTIDGDEVFEEMVTVMAQSCMDSNTTYHPNMDMAAAWYCQAMQQIGMTGAPQLRELANQCTANWAVNVLAVGKLHLFQQAFPFVDGDKTWAAIFEKPVFGFGNLTEKMDQNFTDEQLVSLFTPTPYTEKVQHKYPRYMAAVSAHEIHHQIEHTTSQALVRPAKKL